MLNSNYQVTVNLINNEGKQMKVMVDGMSGRVWPETRVSG